MKYEVESISAVERKISIEVTHNEVDIAINTVIGQKRDVIEKKGFRKGEVPDSVIFQDHKEEVLSLAAQQIFAVRIKEVLAKCGVVPLNRVQVQSEEPLEKGQGFRFSFSAEIIPDLNLPDINGIELEIKAAEVMEADVDRIIASLREQLSKLEPVNEDRTARNGDVVEFDFGSQGELKKMMGMNGTGHKLEIGAGQAVEGFESILKSLKPGGSKVDRITYPDDFPNPALAGQVVKTEITLKRLYRKILPELDESLAKEIAGVASVRQMREAIRQRHQQRLTRYFEQKAKYSLLEELVRKADVPLCRTYVTRNLEEMMGEYTMAMQEKGITRTELSRDADNRQRQFTAEAETAARRQLLLLSIAKKEQLKLESAEVEREISRQAEAAETDMQQFMLDARNTGHIRSIKDSLMMQKVMDLLYERAAKKYVA